MMTTAEHQVATSVGQSLALVAGIGILFQIGHFAEHALQFFVWLTGNIEWVVTAFCGRDTPFMSQGVMYAVSAVGSYLFPDANVARQTMIGVEMLHLIGNTIFLVSIGCLNQVIHSRWARYAFYIEGFHLLEHLLLTLTVLHFGQPLGLSTLFGYAPELWGSREGAVGYRVSWHFAMNLAPLPFVMYAVSQERLRMWNTMARTAMTG